MINNFSRVLTDREPINLPKQQISGQGYITLSARIARIGIQTYFGHELFGVNGDIEPDKNYRVYRAEEEVFAVDTLASFEGLPVTLGHPPLEVSADNYKEFAVGHVIGSPVRDGDFLRAELTIRDTKAIEKIKSGETVQLSAGYHAEISLEAGFTPDGQAYDALQSQIRGNHIALVDAARCGPECTIDGSMKSTIGDAKITDCNCASCQSIKEQNMSDYATLDGETLPLAEAVEKLKDANSRMAAALKEAETTIEALSAELETKTGEAEALSAKENANPTQDAAFSAKVQARAQMLSEARQVLGGAAVLGALTDADIRRKVIDQIYGDGFASGASDHALIGMYKVAIRDALRSDDTLNGRITSTAFSNELKQAETRRNQRLSGAWKQGA